MTFVRDFLRRIGLWLLLPISAIQGLRLSSNALRMPEASGDKTGSCGQGEQLHLLAMGDSIIAGVGCGTVTRSLPVQFAHALADYRHCNVQWCVDGANGADISHLLMRINQIDKSQKADVVLISIGVNDVTGLSTTRHWESQLKSLITELRSKWPKAFVIFAGIPMMEVFPLLPRPLRSTLGLRSAKLDTIAANIITNHPNMLHIPTVIDPLHQEFCDDGFHPSSEACGIWAEELVQRIKCMAVNVCLPGR